MITKLKVFGAIAAALSLAGCVTTELNDGLNFLVGQDVHYAFAKLGYPSGQASIAGDTVYTWGVSRNVMLPMSTTSTTVGNVGATPVFGTTTGTAYVPANFNCTIQLGVGSDNIIKTWHWEGNLGGCMQYAQALRSR